MIAVICPPFLLRFWVALTVWNAIQLDYIFLKFMTNSAELFFTLAFRIHNFALCVTSLNHRGANDSELTGIKCEFEK